MTRQVVFTRYECLRDDKGNPESRSWPEWVEMFSRHERRGSVEDGADEKALNAAKDGICYVLGEIPQGQGHKGANVVAVHALGLDLDDVDEAGLAAVVEAIAPYAWVAYTSHRHAAPAAGGKIKVRFVLPLREPLPPAKHKAAWQALNKLVGGRNDRKTKDVGRVFFAPSTWNPDVAWSLENEGEWIDAERLVAGSGPSADRATRSLGAAALLRLLERGRPGPEILDAVRAVAKGEPFAPKGSRHEVALQVTMWLAQKSREQPFSEEAIREAFAPSYGAMAARDGEAPDVEDAVRCYTDALAKVAEWETQAKAEAIEKAYEHQLRNAPVGQGKYTDDELRAIAEKQGLATDGSGGAAEALRRRWIIQAGDSAFYLLAGDGAYRGPFPAGTARTAAVEILARAPVLLNEPLAKGGYRRRPVQELAEDFGMVAVEIVADLTAQETTFDERRRRVFEAVRPLSPDVAPRFDEQIDGWLKVFAGDQYGKLCDWLACVPDLDKLLCAVYVAGHSGAGKTILAQGLARLWSDTPGELDKVLSDFNDEIVRCPLVLADEALPRHWKGNSITTKLRSIISTLERTLTRKYLPPCTLRGAIRLIITANNEFLLSNKDAVSGQDLEAVARRFLYIDAPEEATRLLESLPAELRDGWAKGGIASHALWLAQNRKVERGRRFWVEGDVSQMHRLLLVSSDWTSRVCDWLVHFLMNPKPYLQRNDGLIRVGKGRLLVNEESIVQGWKLYLYDTNIEPETGKVCAAVRAISKKERPCLRWKNPATGKAVRYRYREIMVDMLFGWAKSNVGHEETMLRTLWDGETPPSAEREPGEDDSDEVDGLDVPAINAAEEPF